MAKIIRPSQRGLDNLKSGAFIDLENEITGRLPEYDRERCPNGYINLSGAVNTLMDDSMAKWMESFAAKYQFHQG